MAAVIIPRDQLRIPEHLRGRLDRPALRVVAAPGANGATVVPLGAPGAVRRVSSSGIPARRRAVMRPDGVRARPSAPVLRPGATPVATAVGRTPRRRSAATLVVVACMAVVSLTGITALATGGPPAAPAPAAVAPATPAVALPAGGVWVVQPGDSLWSIAAAVAPGADLRPVVDELARRAGGGSLQPGQRIPVDGLAP